MSATWSIANGRFDTLVACSSVRGSSSPAHDLIGTRPGLVTMGRAVAVALAAVVDVSEVSMVDMIAGPPASTVGDVHPVGGGQNETGSSDGGAGRKAAGRSRALPLSMPPIGLQPMTAGSADTTTKPNAWSAFRSVESYRGWRLVITGLVLSWTSHAGGRIGTDGGRVQSTKLSTDLAGGEGRSKMAPWDANSAGGTPR